MALKRMDRSCRTEPGWRLATVQEAKDNLESIKRDNLLQKWDRARLLDGWIGGAGYDLCVQVGFRSCLGYMLVVESPTPEICNTDDRNALLYSEVALSKEGKRAALLLCCEDWNYEVLYWFIEGEKKEGYTRGNAISSGDETEVTSKLVSAVARELHGVRAKGRVPRTEFSCASMAALTIDIQKEVEFRIFKQESEGGEIANDILSRALLRTDDIGDQCWKEMGLTEDLKTFQAFGFDTSVPSTWEAVADTVWYAAADAMAVVIVTECCRVHNRLVMNSVPLAERKRMDDRAFVESLIAYAYELLRGTFFSDESLWKIVAAAAEEAEGDCKRFNEILRDRGYGTFSYNGKSDVVNSFLVQAAKKGDVNLVERLIESGVHPTEIDDRGKTALHYAAKLDDESKGLEIAEMLLTEKSLANAVDYKMRTPLHRAASCGHATMCGRLLNYDASVTSTDNVGQTPLHHALLGEAQIEEVVCVLISAEGEDTVEGSARLVDAKDRDGVTPLDIAVMFHATNVRMVALLLSLSGQRQSYFKKLPLSLTLYLRESSRMGYKDLVQELVTEKADPLDRDDEGKTTFHYAAEGANDTVALEIIKGILSHEKQEVNDLIGKAASARDKYGRNVLHVAAFLGHKKLCRWLFEQIPNIDTKDHDGQSAIYYAVAGAHDDNEVLDEFIFRGQATTQVFMKDDSHTTPLHVAAAKGNLKMVEKLLSKRVISGEKREAYVGAPDVLGQTALHKSASGGYKKIVRKLLDEGAHPIEERDSDGKTALHYAAQAENGEDAVAIAKLLLDKCESDKHRSLLLFASAVGIGSAEKSLSSSSLLKDYLVSKKSEILRKTGEKNLLTVAATLGNIDMTRELLTRGANIAVIRNEKWRDELPKQEKENVEDVLKQIDNLLEQGTDKPALWDNLGRSAYANGLAALFLNPFVKSPITVGISGEWGMGKSSLMVQTERILIQTAAQLAFSNSFQKEDFPGASESKLSAKGEARRRKIANALERLLTTKSRERLSKPVDERSGAEEVPKFRIIRKIGMFSKRVLGNGKNFTAKVIKNIVRVGVLALRALWIVLWIESAPLTFENGRKFNEFLANYEPKYHQILKSVAVMDRRDMFEDEVESGSRNQRLGGMPWEEDSMQRATPSVLTVRYNAWQYRNESEAWAGLAVEITKELEATMTVAHKLRTSWRYNWRTRRNSICFGVILPCFLAVLVAIWFTTIVWLIFDRAQNKAIQGFKYGGLPASVIVAAWGVGKSTISIVKPISSQVVDYICLPDHSQKLGYHQKVIFDINFLKDELCYRPSWLWKVFAFIWCCITFSWDGNYVPGTMIRKMPPAFKDNLRMVVFVDDLDRCQENVILQILSAVNQVLATCEINVILGMDKSMIERAIIRKFGDKNSKPNKSSEDLADKYLRKIIQLPLDLPDPSNSEYEHFLQGQLGRSDSRKGATHSEAQRERPNTYGHRKVNPKFQMGTSILMKTKLARGETIKSLAETGAKQERARSISGTAQTGFQKMKREETIGKPGLGVNETKTENCQNWCKFRVKNIVRGGVNSLQTLWNALYALLNESAPYVCGNFRLFNERSKIEKTDIIDIEQSIESSEEATGENNQNAGFQKQAEDSGSKRKLMDLYPITTEMLIPRYSEGEKEAFCFLHTRSTRSRRLPRDWKCLLTYHRLAWNILSKSPEVIPLAGWQVQLIAWVFVCWQWKHLITTLVQNWHKLRVLRNWITAEENSGPSLREIVEHYIDEKWPADKKSDILQGDNATQKNEETIDNVNEKVCANCCNNTEEVEKTSGNLPEKNMRAISSEEDTKGEDYLKADLRKVLKEKREQKRGHFLKIKGLQRSRKSKRKHVEQDDLEGGLKLAIRKVLQEEDVRDMLKVIMVEAFKEREKQPGDVSASKNEKASHKAIKNGENKANDEEREEWSKLKETLSRYNVSMDGIQAFQKFRFYCEPRYLPWPLPK